MEENTFRKIAVKPTHIIEKEEGDVFWVGTSPYGNRFFRLRKNQVSIFDTWKEIGTFSIEAEKINGGEVHPKDEIRGG